MPENRYVDNGKQRFEVFYKNALSFCFNKCVSRLTGWSFIFTTLSQHCRPGCVAINEKHSLQLSALVMESYCSQFNTF